MFNISNVKPHARVQLHALRSHAASNLNRDDLGRPKEMVFGGKSRLRISSQSLKRSMRMGEVFDSLRGHIAQAYGSTRMIRTTQIEEILVTAMVERGLAADKALEGARALSATLSKSANEEEKPATAAKPGKKSKDAAEVSDKGEAADAGEDAVKKTQLLAISQGEIDFIVSELMAVEDKSSKTWAKQAIERLKDLKKQRNNRLLRGDLSPEMALFGRMVTSDLFNNIDASVQVAHAFTVHEVVAERDYWTGVDDRREAAGEAGSGMIDVRKFGAGVFYQYACIDVDLLKSNLRDSHIQLDSQKIDELARDIIGAFIIAFAGQNPTGYQNSFASHAMPDVLLAEVGGVFPHSAAAAFETPVTARHEGYSAQAKVRMGDWLEQRRKSYGELAVGRVLNMGLNDESVSLNQLVEQVAAAV